MKKSSFVALVLSTVSVVVFALGMCMALLPEWNLFGEGIALGGLGLILGLVTLLVWCGMTGRKLPKFSGKNVLRGLYGLVAVLVLGLGMCMCMVWHNFVWGTLVGLVGILMLLFMIPMIKGFK